jgi:CHAT domain-containing protein
MSITTTQGFRGRIALTLGAGLAGVFLAAPCAGACSDSVGTQIQSFERSVSGRERIRERLNAPPSSRLLIEAAETGIDVFLQADAGRLVADNPSARWGPQRLIVETGRSGHIEIELVGKEHSLAKGDVRVRVAALTSASSGSGEACERVAVLLASGDRHFAATQMSVLGLKALPPGGTQTEHRSARRDYQAAAAIAESQRAMQWAAHAHLSAGGAVYQAMTVLTDARAENLSWELAQQEARLAERAFRELNDAYGVTRARALDAAARIEVAVSLPQGQKTSAAAELEGARETLTQLASEHGSRGEVFDQALALNNLGMAYYYDARFEDAIRAYRGAVPLYEQLSERPRQAQSLQNVALMQYELGRFSAALASFAQVLGLLEERDNPNLYADILNNRGLAEYASGNLDAALRNYTSALAILTRIDAKREEARSLHGIGTVYYALGDRDLAAEYFSRALPLRNASPDPRGRIATLRSLANVLSDAGRASEALAIREQAFALTAGTPSLRARVLVQMARDTAALGKRDDALKLVGQALTEGVSGDEIGRAQALTERATLNLEQGSASQAARDTAEARAVFRRFESPLDEFATLLLAARIERAQGRFDRAVALLDEAIALADQVRLQSANPELRAGLWHPVRPAFDLKIQVLADLARARRTEDSAAASQLAHTTLEIAEQFRGRTLRDFTRLAELGRAPPGERDREQQRDALYQEIATRRFRLESYLDRVMPEDSRVGAIRTEIAALRRQIDLLNAELAAARQARPASVAPNRSRVSPGLAGLPPDSAAIVYWLGEPTAYAWFSASGVLQRVDLGPSSRIEATARALQAALDAFGSTPTQERLRLAREMYRLILEPLPASVLRARSLTFVPDGALHRVSFAMLASGPQDRPRFLIDSHDIAIAPTAGAITAFEGQQGSFAMDLLLIADPVYSADDERLAPKAGAVPPGPAARPPVPAAQASRLSRRLPGTAREAEAIGALFDPRRSDRMIGFDASRAALLERDLARYRYIHIAAHGTADAGSPKFSQVLLSTFERSGHPIVGEVFAGDLAMRRIAAEVVVFSACETAVGRPLAGEGLLGLGYAAHAGGARAVVASLWQAPDRTSSELMSAFYRALVHERSTPRAAMAAAMRKVRATFADPALWAAFQLSVYRPTGDIDSSSHP